MRPFFKHFGSKYELSSLLPPPSFFPIIEAFAGAGGYSTRYGENRRVLLYDTSPDVCEIWRYLLGVSVEDILKLPVDFGRTDIRELGLPRPAMLLIQRWLTTQGSTSNWMVPPALDGDEQRLQSIVWGSPLRARIARQLRGIQHWEIHQESYTEIPDLEATWLIDPPYQKNRHACSAYGCPPLDYQRLAEWVKTRRGAVMVHEQAGADWLPFESLKFKARTGRGSHEEGRKTQQEVWWHRGLRQVELFEEGGGPMTRQARELVRLRRALQLLATFDPEASGRFASDVLAGGDPDVLAAALLDEAERAAGGGVGEDIG